MICSNPYPYLSSWPVCPSCGAEDSINHVLTKLILSALPCEPFALRDGFSSRRSANAPVTYTVAALVPSANPQPPSLVKTGTRSAGATISGFLWGSFRGSRIGSGRKRPLLSPSDDPDHEVPFSVEPPTEMTAVSLEGCATSPSSSSPPSLPAAATT